MDKNLVLDYLRATTNLYGMIPLEKVVEIYNQQNQDALSVGDLGRFKNMPNESFEYRDGYFVHEAVSVMGDYFYQLLHVQGNKPFYTPPKEDLLKYADDEYTERPKEFQRLQEFVEKEFALDPELAEEITDDIHLGCFFDFNVSNELKHLMRRGIELRGKEQLSQLVGLISDLANNSRVWENRGYTPREVFERMERPYLRPLPVSELADHATEVKRVGRNDACPCGSGKKHKKCCLDKERLNLE